MSPTPKPRCARDAAGPLRAPGGRYVPEGDDDGSRCESWEAAYLAAHPGRA